MRACDCGCVRKFGHECKYIIYIWSVSNVCCTRIRRVARHHQSARKPRQWDDTPMAMACEACCSGGYVVCVGFGCMTDARTPAQTNKNRPRDAALRRWRRCRTLGTHFDDVPKIQGAPPPNPNTHIEHASKTCVLAYAYSHRICAPVHSWNRCFWGRLPPATRVFANQREGTIERVYVWTES